MIILAAWGNTVQLAQVLSRLRTKQLPQVRNPNGGYMALTLERSIR